MRNPQAWDTGRFHAMLVERVGAAVGMRVLDLGCGRGNTLGPLLAAVGPSGSVVGLDRLSDALAVAATRQHAALAAGYLALVRGDVVRPPFPDRSFDAIICQNVVECVPDRLALVAAAQRLLRPGGRLLLGHHDFDGVLLAGGDPDVTRRLVHGYADYRQDWQQAAEGRMGRMLSGLIADCAHAGIAFEAVELETSISVDLDFGPSAYAHDYVASLVALAPDFGLDRSEVATWLAELHRAVADQRFFCGVPWMSVLCRRQRDSVG